MPTVQQIRAYYNRYASSQNYKKLRFIAGAGSSSSEMNELQEILINNTKDIFDTLFKNGSIISGGNITRDNQTLLIESAIIYYEGLSINVPTATLQIVANSDDNLGILISEDIITATQEQSLLNPAVGTILYKTLGADRLKIAGTWRFLSSSLNLPANQKFYPLYSIVNGNLNEIETVKKTELQNTQSLLEKYDYDSNGNYVVNGLSVYFDSDLSAEFKYLLAIKNGVCHVNGKEYTFAFTNKIKVNYPLVTKTIIGEPAIYQTAVSTYKLRNYPIQSVSQILAMKLKSNINITHGNFLGVSDLLPNTPVASVLLVKQGATTYVQNVDYRVIGDTIDWSLNGAEPAAGSTYQVTFTYVETNITYSISSDLTSLIIPSSNGLQDNSSLFITYSFYLPRKDRLIVNTAGQLEILEGYPVPINPVPLSIKDGLSLAIISVYYGTVPTITMDTLKAFKMSDILNLQTRLDLIEFNISQLSLAEDVRATDPTTNKLNMFVDSFYDDDLRDFGQTQSAIIVNKNLIPDVTYTSKIVRQGNEIILDYTDIYAISQDSFTKSRQINEFTWQSAPPASLTITPISYRWISTEVVKEIWDPVENRDWKHWSSPNRVIINADTAVETSTSVGYSDADIDTPLPPVAINLTGGKWNYNEQIDLYFDSKYLITFNADAQGLINYNFATPVGSKSGNLPIKLVGKVSGVMAEAVFSAQPISKNITNRHQTFYVWNDPIAQTFTLTTDTFVKSIEIYFETNTTNFVDVFICKTQVGIPDRTKAIVKKRLYAQQIFINQWQEFLFDFPVVLNANEEYALIVECVDSIAKVKVAELGQFAANTGKWLTGQALDTGVLLNSANGSTWSPIQKEDLSFKIKACNFSLHKEVALGIVSVTNCTDLVLLAGVDIPSSTSIKFQAVLLNRSNETYDITPYVGIELLTYTGDIQVKATLDSLFNNISPAIEGNVLLSIGTVNNTASYISRTFNISTSSMLTVIADINEPSTSSVVIKYKNTAGTFVSLTRNPAKSENLGNGWVRVVYEQSITNLTSTCIQIILNTTDVTQRPYCRNLRCYTRA